MGPTDDATFARTIYLLVYPQGTTLSDAPGRKSCNDFFGYHSRILPPPPADGGVPEAGDAGAGDGGVTHVPIVYAPIGRCKASNYTEAETLTTILAHEMIEAATNPYGGGYRFVAPDYFPWTVAMHGAELTDMCNIDGSFWYPPGIGYAIPRSWSNAKASAFHDPCVPGPPGETYFNSFIVPKDKLSLDDSPSAPIIDGLRVRVGETKTFDVFLFSDGPTSGPWMIAPREIPLRSGNRLALTLSLDRTTGVNGEKTHLTITANEPVSNGVTVVGLFSRIDTRLTLWFTPVSVQ